MSAQKLGEAELDGNKKKTDRLGSKLVQISKDLFESFFS